MPGYASLYARKRQLHAGKTGESVVHPSIVVAVVTPVVAVVSGPRIGGRRRQRHVSRESRRGGLDLHGGRRGRSGRGLRRLLRGRSWGLKRGCVPCRLGV